MKIFHENCEGICKNFYRNLGEISKKFGVISNSEKRSKIFVNF